MIFRQIIFPGTVYNQDEIKEKQPILPSTENSIKKSFEDVSTSASPHFKKFLTEQEKKNETITSMMVTKNENEHEFSLPHPIWSDVEVDSVQINHKKPKSMSDRLGMHLLY